MIDMSGNLAVAGIILLMGAIFVYFKSRSGSRNGRRSRVGILPVVAFFSAPLIAAGLWALDVFVINRDYYPLPSDAWALLPPIMFIGLMVGLVSALTFMVAGMLKSHHADTH
jgi:hypothetical protein